jgi:hypothetical protein
MQVIDHKTKRRKMYPQLLFLKVFFITNQYFLNDAMQIGFIEDLMLFVIKRLLLMKIMNPFGYRG